MKMIKITTKKLEDMSDLVEDMLRMGGKLMSCLDKMSEEMYEERDDDEEYNERRMSKRDREDYNERRYRGRR